jgi:L,D-transpeptidase catalytic domain
MNEHVQACAIGLTARTTYMPFMKMDMARRGFIKFGAAASVTAAAIPALASTVGDGLSPEVLRRAMAAFAKHRTQLLHSDKIGIVDFSRPSSSPRLFILDAATLVSQSHLVAHGRGSDPAHTGWAHWFSNEPGSYASSVGAYVTGGEYTGQHGRSMRLSGLDAENCNAESRAIVVHAAWYVTPAIATRTGMLGRSQGCFAVSSASLGPVLDQLGTGRLLYAART